EMIALAITQELGGGRIVTALPGQRGEGWFTDGENSGEAGEGYASYAHGVAAYDQGMFLVTVTSAISCLGGTAITLGNAKADVYSDAQENTSDEHSWSGDGADDEGADERHTFSSC